MEEMMNLNEKTDVCYNIGFNTELNEQTNLKNQTIMNNNTRNQLEFQFKSAIPPKIIICFNCRREAELDGYLFRLVPACFNCRTESEVQITRNRFERRRAAR